MTDPTQGKREALEQIEWVKDLVAERDALRAENARLRGEVERLCTAMAVCGATIDPDGSLVLDSPKWNAAHYCEEHRGTQWVDDCAACLRARVRALEEGLKDAYAAIHRHLDAASANDKDAWVETCEALERSASRARALLKTADGEGGGE